MIRRPPWAVAISEVLREFDSWLIAALSWFRLLLVSFRRFGQTSSLILRRYGCLRGYRTLIEDTAVSITARLHGAYWLRSARLQ